jgi:hypothetical protein
MKRGWTAHYVLFIKREEAELLLTLQVQAQKSSK